MNEELYWLSHTVYSHWLDSVLRVLAYLSCLFSCMLFKDNITAAIYFIVFFGSRIISSWKRGRRNALSGGEKQGVGGADRKLENIE